MSAYTYRALMAETPTSTVNGRRLAWPHRLSAGAVPAFLAVVGLSLLLAQAQPLTCDVPTFGLLLAGALVLAATPARLPAARAPLSLTAVVLLASQSLCGSLALGTLALAGSLLVASLGTDRRFKPAWECGASLLSSGAAALAFAVAGAAAGPAAAEALGGVLRGFAFGLGLWAGQMAAGLAYAGARDFRPDWPALLTTLALVPPGIYLAQLARGDEPLVFAASLALTVGLLVLVRGLTNVDTRARELEAQASISAEARDKLELIVDHAPEAIIAVDEQGRIQWLNHTAAAWLGETAPRLIGAPAAEAIPLRPAAGGEPLDHAELLSRARASGKPIHEEGLLESAPEAPERVLASYTAADSPDADGTAGTPAGLGLLVLRDAAVVTESLREQEELAIHLSHELRAPLTTILGYAQLLSGLPPEKLSGGAREEFVKRINESGDYMLRLVNNLLDMGRLERGSEQMIVTRVEPIETTEAVVDGLRPQALEKGQGLQVERSGSAGPMEICELYLRQVLTNLVANAIKYTPAGGSITVRLEESPDEVVWHVEDTGIGLSPDEQARLFTKFFRSARPEARLIKGTGLGLALTKQLVDRMGGSIAVQGEVDHGSTFTVRLPRRAA